MIALTPRQSEIADYLHSRAGRWCPMYDILDAIWPWGVDVGNVKVQIFRMRAKGCPIRSARRGPASPGYMWQEAA